LHIKLETSITINESMLQQRDVGGE